MESRTIALIKEAGKRGLFLSELAAQLEQPASKIIQILDSLLANGSIEKSEEQHNGESDLRIFWRDKIDSEWDTLQGCPCFSCHEIDMCGAGNPLNPWICEKLGNWISNQVEKKS